MDVKTRRIVNDNSTITDFPQVTAQLAVDLKDYQFAIRRQTLQDLFRDVTGTRAYFNNAADPLEINTGADLLRRIPRGLQWPPYLSPIPQERSKEISAWRHRCFGKGLGLLHLVEIDKAL